MREVAIKMLFGDKAKYLALVFGITFATLLMSQQVSIFLGIMNRVTSIIHDVSEADVWVMDTRVRYIEEVEPLRDIELPNVRSVSGVEWAEPFYKGLATIRMADGMVQTVQLIGVDQTSLAGICPKMVMGKETAVREQQSAIIDKNGFFFIWPKEELHLGKLVELNDNRVLIDGICDARPTFLTYPILYLSYNKVMEIIPQTRTKMSFILVKGKNGISPEDLARKISEETNLQALTKEQFAARSIDYILHHTGIVMNFGLTIFLGILIGAAITAQTFYIFIIENLRQFGTMKAVGVTNNQLMKIVLLQAAIVGLIGYSLGIGFTAIFFKLMSSLPAFTGFFLRWQVMLGSGLIVFVIVIIAITFSLRKVFSLDPAIVFRG
jgi:putative ABC transport system permease protein